MNVVALDKIALFYVGTTSEDSLEAPHTTIPPTPCCAFSHRLSTASQTIRSCHGRGSELCGNDYEVYRRSELDGIRQLSTGLDSRDLGAHQRQRG